MPNRNAGFSLIEVAVVMFIMTLLLGSLLVPLQTQVEQRQISDAEKALNESRDALLGFAVAYGRLPCADIDGDGFEDTPCAGAPTAQGFLPWKVLGVTATDPWGNAWRYRPNRNFSQSFSLSTQSNSADNIRVQNSTGTTELTSSQERAVAVIYSVGPNRTAEPGNAEFEPSNANYRSDIRTANFDDLLIWIGRPTLFNRMVAAGKLP